MSSTPSNIPLPKDPRHQRFADHRLRGDNLRDSYKAAGYKLDAKSSSNAKRLEAREDVQAYMRSIRQQAAQGSVMDMQEKREYFARLKRTPLLRIDPADPDDPNADLVKKFKRKVIEGNEKNPEAWVYDEIEKFDVLKAIVIDNDLAGEGGEAGAKEEFAQMLAHMRNTP